ncbi:TonB-dependent receptor, partial [bacterium]|nr:TonB-dependent receptor [candidate division CSSED10-310 bacterium]
THFSDRLVGALAVYAPNLFGAVMPEDAPTRYLATKAYFITTYVTAATAYKLTDKIAMGGGINYIYVALEGNRKFGDYDNPDADPDNDWDLHLDGQEHNANFGFGLTYKPICWMQIGLSYTSEVTLTMDGDFELSPPKGRPGKVSGSQSTKIPIPQSLRLGFHFDLSKRVEYAVDLSWFDYSVFQVQETVVTPPLPFDPSSPKDYSDSWNLGMGVVYHFRPRVDLMGGLQYDWSPVPEQTYSLENPTSDLWGFSFGVGYQWTAQSKVTIAYVHNEYASVNIHNSKTFPPTNGIGQGSNNELSMDWTYSF